MPPLITAVVCTHNRVDYLPRALDSLVEQSLPADGYEILVVDNASTDATEDLIQRYCAKYPHVKYVREEKLGLSAARNRGWRTAKADYVAFLDDDAAACHGWLERLLDAFDRVRPVPGFIGGKVTLDWEMPRPGWLSDDMLSPLAWLDYGEEARFLRDEYLWGVNMAFPKRLLEKVGGFEENLGRKGEALISNEETWLQDALSRMGHRGYYRPDAQVSHLVHHSRLSKKWYRRRYFWQGYSDVLSSAPTATDISGTSLRHLMKAVGTLLYRVKKGYKYFLPYKDFNVLRYQIQVSERAGAVFAWYRMVCDPQMFSGRVRKEGRAWE
jgi:glycosyltransferase involved in cell wall biosynthesis